MPRVIFTKTFNYDHRPARGVCQSFEPSKEPVLVTTPIAEAAIAAGAAEAADTKERAPVSRKRAE